jgi:hypothetical protein
MMLTYLHISQFLPSTYLNLSFITHGDQLLSMSEEREIEKTDQHQSGKVQEQRSAPDNVVIINYQIIINGMDIANESLKQYSELMENLSSLM